MSDDLLHIVITSHPDSYLNIQKLLLWFLTPQLCELLGGDGQRLDDDPSLW
ncbi:UNVERIFIED_CONTAM: hypothetical protein FKN15_064706 [Acipenser sinensis]